MSGLLLLPVGLAVVLGLVYLLYINGIGVINSKSALMYQGYPRVGKNKNRIKVKFMSCCGTTRRVVCLHPGKKYRFVFSATITKGAVCVEISDKQKENLLVLDQQHPSVILSAGPGGRLYVTTQYTKADGEYELSWDVQE